MVGRCISYWSSPFRGHVSFLGCNDWKTGGDVLVFEGGRPSWWLVYQFFGSRIFLPRKFGKKIGFERHVLKIGWINHQLCWLCFFLDVICCELSLLFSLLFLAFFLAFLWFFVDALFCLEVAGLIFVFGWAHPQESPPGFLHLARNRDSELDLHLPFLLGG